MSRLSCCVPGCSVYKLDGIPLHQFPDPSTHPEIHKKWLSNIGGEVLTMDTDFLRRNRKVCRKHFRDIYLYPNNQLSIIAVPELNLPIDPVCERGACCRTCMATTSLLPLKSVSDSSFIEMLNATTGLHVQLNDKLPQHICQPCLDNVTGYHNFRNKCMATHKMLTCLKQDDNNIANTSIDDCNSNSVKCKMEPENSFVQIERSIEDILKECTPIQIDNIAPYTKSDTVKCIEKPNILQTTNISVDRVSHECKTCNKMFQDRKSYDKHTRSHLIKSVVCEHCGVQFHHMSRLLMHCKAKHGYTKTDKCAYCDYVAINAEAVKIHERLHTGEKPYACDLCDARFHRKSSCIQHRPIHLTEKTVQCDVCPARFKSTTLMRIHKSKHKPRKYKFKCRECGALFGKRWHCVRHVRRVHGVAAAADEVHRIRLTE